MAKRDSMQNRMGNKPRVHLAYKVEIGGAIEEKELPFVIGVIGDFTGQPDEPLPRLRERNLTEVRDDTLDQVMAAMKPRLAYRVKNTLAQGRGDLNIELRFEKLDDFTPDEVVKRVEPLSKLIEVRQKLHDLLTKMDGNEPLREVLRGIAKNKQQQRQLSNALGIDGSRTLGASPEAEAEGGSDQ